jgi:putative ABC transport system permease protein
MVLRQGLNLVLFGLGAGFLGALAAAGTVKSLLFGVSAMDAVTFLGVAIVLLGSAFLASYIPARRASHVEPMEALRYE